jgi:hypothetical protein
MEASMVAPLNGLIDAAYQVGAFAVRYGPSIAKGIAIVALTFAISEVADDILDEVDEAHIPATIAALAIMAKEFDDFKRSPEFKRPGNHWAEIWGPTGDKKEFSTRVDWVKRIRDFTLTKKSGGMGGRVFQFKYGIGQNANWKQGLFIFRLDHLDCEVTPPAPGIHYHVQWGPVQKDHVKFD